jgi:short chain dehydrogenase
LIAADGALVVNVSYYGAVSYHLDPAYGATKAGLDKLTFDMAQDFKPYREAVVSIWPGTTATERAQSVLAKIPGVSRYSKARRHLSFLVSLSLRCIRIRNGCRNREAWSSQPKQPWSTDSRISMASSRPAFENRRALRARSSRGVEFTTPRSPFLRHHRSGISIPGGSGLFTKDTAGNRVFEGTNQTGGFLLGCR